MATGLLLDKRLSGRTLRDSRIVVDEAACTGATFTTLLNPDGDGKNYRLAVWNASGIFAVAAPGEVEYLVLSGAGAALTYGGEGGRILVGKQVLPAGTLPVTVGSGATGGTDAGAGQMSGYSQLGSIITGRAAAGYNFVMGARGGYPTATTDYAAGFPSSITGTAVDYGRSARVTPTANLGEGGQTSTNGSSGVVIARWEI